MATWKPVIVSFVVLVLCHVAMAQTGSWTQATANAQWSPREGHATLVYNNRLWLLGGDEGGGVRKNDVWYTTDGVNWTSATLSAQWSPRKDHAAAVFDNKMWILGGNSGGSPNIMDNEVWYSTDGITWTEVPPQTTSRWAARADHTALVYNNWLWVMGGNGNVEVQFDVWYSTDGITWSQRTYQTPHWFRRYAHTSVAFGGEMWLLGGRDQNLNAENDVWSSTDGTSWTEDLTNAPWSARPWHASAVFDSKMWVLGGGTGYLNDIWTSTNGTSWTQETASAPWTGRRHHAAAVFNAGSGTRLWVVGGTAAGGGTLNDVWSYNPSGSTGGGGNGGGGGGGDDGGCSTGTNSGLNLVALVAIGIALGLRRSKPHTSHLQR